MGPSIVDKPQPRFNLDGGRPLHPGVHACEALVEAIAAIGDDAVALDSAARHLAAIQRCATRLGHEVAVRAERLITVVLPDVQLGYEAAESAYAATA